MRSIGSTLLILGIGSIVLDFFDYVFVVISWIDHWGEATGWTIRAVMIGAGAILFFLDGWIEHRSSAPAEEAPRQEPTLQAAAPAPSAAPSAAPDPDPGSGPAEADAGADPLRNMQNP